MTSGLAKEKNSAHTLDQNHSQQDASKLASATKIDRTTTTTTTQHAANGQGIKPDGSESGRKA